MYKLRYEAAAEAVWDALPDGAREELERALVATCENPYATTQPANRDDGDVKRLLVLRHSVVVLVVIEPPIKRVRLLHITYLD